MAYYGYNYMKWNDMYTLFYMCGCLHAISMDYTLSSILTYRFIELLLQLWNKNLNETKKGTVLVLNIKKWHNYAFDG